MYYDPSGHGMTYPGDSKSDDIKNFEAGNVSTEGDIELEKG